MKDDTSIQSMKFFFFDRHSSTYTSERQRIRQSLVEKQRTLSAENPTVETSSEHSRAEHSAKSFYAIYITDETNIVDDMDLVIMLPRLPHSPMSPCDYCLNPKLFCIKLKNPREGSILPLKRR